jgi:Caudovirus prohead protease.
MDVDQIRRTIFDRAVPYGVLSDVSALNRYRFDVGALQWDSPRTVPLLLEHNQALRVGWGVHFVHRPDGLYTRFNVASGPRGDLALARAAAGHRLSIGWENARYADGDHLRCIYAELTEISLVATPAFPHREGAPDARE